jgi:hypothetical protein
MLEQIVFSSSENVDVLPIKMTIFSFWSRSDSDTPENGLQRVSLHFPSDQPSTILGEIAIDLASHIRYRIFNTFLGIPYFGDGTYRFTIEVQQNEIWQTVASLPLDVRRQKQLDVSA